MKPKRIILASGFTFKHSTMSSALADLAAK
ncbi:MAG: DUF1731 domain-containing protein [Verrucomicrobiaceae bacterium]|nr:DUF1731 domain-containing protein [Verrucomicrobiaceae bacterium]